MRSREGDRYELRDIPAGAPEAESRTEPEAYTAAIYDGDRWVFRFRSDGLRKHAKGWSHAEDALDRLNGRD